MNVFEIIGMIAVGILALCLLAVLYTIVKAFVLAADFIMWQYTITKQSKPDTKFSVRIFVRGVMKNWVDMLDYNPEYTSYSIGDSTWKGFRTWK